jgi:hypothetical protein
MPRTAAASSSSACQVGQHTHNSFTDTNKMKYKSKSKSLHELQDKWANLQMNGSYQSLQWHCSGTAVALQ